MFAVGVGEGRGDAFTDGSGPSSGGSGSSVSNPVVVAITDSELTSGATRIVNTAKSFKINVGSKDKAEHNVQVTKIDKDAKTMTIHIESTPLDVIIKEGESSKIDLDDDGIYDLLIEVLSVNAAGIGGEIKLQSISEEVPEGQGAVSTTGDETGETTSAGEEVSEKGLKSGVLIAIIIVIIIIVAVFYYLKRK